MKTANDFLSEANSAVEKMDTEATPSIVHDMDKRTLSLSMSETERKLTQLERSWVHIEYREVSSNLRLILSTFFIIKR